MRDHAGSRLIVTVPHALRRLAGHPLAPVAVLGAAMLVYAGLLLSLQRGMTFLVDEWALVAERRGWDVETLLTPFYEHLFLVPLLVFKVLMSTIGFDPHWVYAVPLIALHLTCVVLVYVLARARLGPGFALAPAMLILFLGSSYDSMLLPIQVSFLGSVAAGLGMLLALDSAPSRGRDAAASILLLVSLASASVGLVFAIAALVEIVAARGWRGRVWIVVLPAVVYGLWYLAYGARGLEQGGGVRSNVWYVPGYVADSAAALFGALSGLGPEWGRVFAVLALVVVARALVRGYAFSARAIALLAAVVAFWALGGLARAHRDDAEASRYLYPGAVFVVLAIAEAVRGKNLDRRWAVLLAAGIAFAAVGNANSLRAAKNTHLAFSREISAQFAALEVLGRDNVAPDFVAGVYLAPLVDADEYFDMVDELGSPVDLDRDVLAQGDDDRTKADIVFASALGAQRSRFTIVDDARGGLAVEKASLGMASREGPCVRFDPFSAGPATLDVRSSAGGAAIRTSSRSAVTLSLRRFGASFQPVRTLGPGSTFALALPDGGTTTPWRLRTRGRGAVEVCSARIDVG